MKVTARGVGTLLLGTIVGASLCGFAAYLLLRHTDIDPNISLCLLAAVIHLGIGMRLRVYKPANKPIASLAHLSLEERLKRLRLASWICFGIAGWAVAGAIVFAWLDHAGYGASK